MNPEFDVVARLSRLHPTAADTARVCALANAALTWDRVIDLAESHGTLPLVAMHLGQLAPAWVPAEVQTRFRARKPGAAVASRADRERAVPAVPGAP